MRTNLQPDFGNRYYRVQRSFVVFALIGHSKSNTYVGSSMLCGNVYRRLTLTRGDEVHALAGGVFAITKDGHSFSVTLTLSEKHPFEKVYYTAPQQWPLENLRLIADREARRPAQYRDQLPTIPAGRYYGGSIDSVVE